jgi:beta-aspartyl-peptidase (threonine type)
MTETYTLVIHAGCEHIVRERFTRQAERERLDALRQSLAAGRKVLENGGPAVLAVEAAVAILEDAPYFNAGRGSVFSHEGTNEMDAAIMDGAGLQAGAVAGIRRVKNPISAARMVMERSGHVLLIGDGAEEFAEQQGLELVHPSYFSTQDRWHEYLHAARGAQDARQPDGEGRQYDTVGAVALDEQGSLAAASSTGGISGKKRGRVGDSPIIGAGIFADQATCAVSCTGQGEYFIRCAAAHRLSALMELQGQGLEEAAASVLTKVQCLGGQGGLIAVDSAGRVALPFLTAGMYRGLIRRGQAPRVAMYGQPGIGV